ncbi:M1 family metallopeptidase [Spongiivirga citrea]|uniref:M1 family peptidase n=1 Tax=Spongiivirga citrea TaxID=1481457 RepID=A0A6M0CIN3_9FLAO|nr:M1 family metallopeptidase [Spongiivirga citrea]NER17382.1 M1 family peptidase [Spongiivirga citrea]
MIKKILLAVFVITTIGTNAQTTYWQQHVDYKMDVKMDVKTFQYTGTQELVYTNNSPDVLNKVYYHLYYNAFQPGSEMDIRLQNIADPDGRMTENLGTKENPNKVSRISKLSPEETGYMHAVGLTQDGQKVQFEEAGTVLEVDLATPINPGESTKLNMEFKGQVPTHIRRAGRNNKEGVALSMAQWYPKLAEYDFEGWHTSPYIAREFHGVWGDFDVKITLDKNYTIGGTGYLQNPNEIGHGYEDEGVKVKKRRGKTLTWHFKAPNVHDFTWAADPEYVHDRLTASNGVVLHFFYKNKKDDTSFTANWKKLQPDTAKLLDFFNKNVGEYPYKQYSVIQGGDGGMEYGMCTLITGERRYGSLFGVTAHEMAHSWFQFVLATNESKHEWMDEGFTSFISELAEDKITGANKSNPFEGTYRGYFSLVASGKEMPQTTHADRFENNFAYGRSAYSKGAVFLAQLGYVIGQENLMKTLQKYYNDFKFKHPTPNDIKRTAEKVSGIHLDWYLTDWTQTTNTIDYGIKSLDDINGKTKVTLERIGLMPMPIDVVVIYKDGTRESFYAPLRMMRGEKENPYPAISRTVLEDWPWAYPTYSFEINKPKSSIATIVIDPSELMADIDKRNNFIQQ